MLVELQWRYGRLFAPDGDQVITRSLQLYGEWAEHEIAQLSSYVRRDTIVLDVGAFVGTHTIALASRHPEAQIVGFEAQPILAAALAINIDKSGLTNASSNNAVCGRSAGLVTVPLQGIADNPGATAITPAFFKGPLGLFNRPLESSQRFVPLLRLDQLVFKAPVSLIKIDVEGMEADVLAGARGLVKSFRPAIAFEVLDYSHVKRVLTTLRGLQYHAFWMESSPFNIDNFNGHSENIWWRTEMSVLVLPAEQPAPNLLPLTLTEGAIPSRLNPRVGVAVS